MHLCNKFAIHSITINPTKPVKIVSHIQWRSKDCPRNFFRNNSNFYIPKYDLAEQVFWHEFEL